VYLEDQLRGVVMVKTKKRSLPRTLGACADELYELKQERSQLNQQLAKLDERRKELEQHLVDQLSAQDAKGISGELVKASIVVERVGTAKDWGKIYAYVKRNGAFHLLQRRLSNTALREIWEAGKKVPGVEIFNHKKVSLAKVRTRRK
jgi:seryl-tRNA synthetase